MNVKVLLFVSVIDFTRFLTNNKDNFIISSFKYNKYNVFLINIYYIFFKKNKHHQSRTKQKS